MKRGLLFIAATFLLITGAHAFDRDLPDDAGGLAPALIPLKVLVHVTDARTGRPLKGADVLLNVMLDSGGTSLFGGTVEDAGQSGVSGDNSLCELDFDVLPNAGYLWRARGWVKKAGYEPTELRDIVLRSPTDGAAQNINVNLRPISSSALSVSADASN